MRLCGANESALSAWTDGGVGHCFADLFGGAVLLLEIALFGACQALLYRVHSQPLPTPLRRRGGAATLQLVLHVVAAVVAPAWLLASALLFKRPVLGHQLVWAVTQMVGWLLANALTRLELRHTLTVSPGPHGHGVVLLTFWAANLVMRNVPLMSMGSPFWWWNFSRTVDAVHFSLYVADYALILIIFVIGLRAPGLPSDRALRDFKYEEIPNGDAADEAETSSAEPRSNLPENQGNPFKNLWSKLKMLAPYIWPKTSLGLQCRVVFCFLLLGCGRLVNLFTPILYKQIVNSLTYPPAGTTQLDFRWDLILEYSAMRFLQNGFLNTVRSFFWIRVQQYTTREVQVGFYKHLHDLSLRWHISRKTGEVLQVMDRGTASINSLLAYILFQIAPTIVDIVIAVVYFVTSFNAWFGLIVFVTMAVYLAATVAVTEWRTKFRRRMNKLSNETRAKGVDSLLNFETVKYYNAEEFEVGRYRNCLLNYQEAEWLSSASLSLLNALQNCVIGFGLLAGSLLCAYMVTRLETMTVGDYVLFATYLQQLYGPLNWLGTYYRMIQQSFIDMENMFDLMSEEEEVADMPGALTYLPGEGRVDFKNVSFHYAPEKPVLSDVSFSILPGQTVALVGPSGAGKSTVIRLLFRFYDVLKGGIYFDDQNIAEVTQKSLRQYIGVVPQDTVLFNDSIRYNIRYGRLDGASDVEVEKAAAAADIHDRILGFPDKYETIVGERGLKLSGGEKQRVAIARTILKAPRIILLDEATSALDTQTERNIQASLERVCAGHTTLIVAHRLSTISHADLILVLQDGCVVERGRHADLLAAAGVYARMWLLQLDDAAAPPDKLVDID